jgi:hypothetical protein
MEREELFHFRCVTPASSASANIINDTHYDEYPNLGTLNSSKKSNIEHGNPY